MFATTHSGIVQQERALALQESVYTKEHHQVGYHFWRIIVENNSGEQ
jgi:hypothetical protein